MRDHVRLQTSVLLRRFAYLVNRASRTCDAETIHDLRVAIRRLSRCLNVFAQFYPDDAGRKIRRELAGLRELAGAVRDRHIALDLLGQCGVPPGAAIVKRLQAEDRQATQELVLEARRWKARGFSRKWRVRLGLLRSGS